MPSFKTYNYPTIMSLFGEAVREIPGYDQYNPEKEVKALIDYDSTVDNVALVVNDCMLLKGKQYKKKTQFIEEKYSSLLGKNPRKDAAACSIVFTLPKNYIQCHDYGLSKEENTAWQNYDETDKKHTAELDSHEMDVLNSVKKKLCHIQWSDEEKEKIKEYFSKSVHSLCKICGIKEADILYAVVHMDESFPHLHFTFMPMEYGKDIYNAAKEDAIKHGEDMSTLKSYTYNGNTVKFYREIIKCKQVEKFHGLTMYDPTEEEHPCGCGIKRFKKDFLHSLNMNLEKEMHLLGIETKISTGKGQKFRVNEHSKALREEQVVISHEMEFQKQQLEQMEALEASTQLQLMRYQNAYEKLKADITGLVESARSLLVQLIKDTVSRFLPLWRDAKANKERIDEQANSYVKDQATNIITDKFIQIKDNADKLIQSISDNDSKMTQQQKDIITKHIQRLARESGNNNIEQVFCQKDILEYCYRRYADTNKDRQYLNDNYIPLSSQEAQEYMRSSNRIKRAFEEVIETVMNEPEKFDNKSVIYMNQYLSEKQDRDSEYLYY